MKPHSLPDLKLTRAVEADLRRETIESFLKKSCQPLWEQSTLTVPQISLRPALEVCLRALFHRRQLERGLEHIEQILGNEQKGLKALQEKLKTTPSHRVSRLLIVANDGSERFYRACEKILIRHSDRVLLLRVDTPSGRLSESLMNTKDKPLKALLVSERDAVSAVLFSLIS